MVSRALVQSAGTMLWPHIDEQLVVRFTSAWDEAGSSETGAAALRRTRREATRGDSIVFHMVDFVAG